VLDTQVAAALFDLLFGKEHMLEAKDCKRQVRVDLAVMVST
jgi:hypothetical protein